MSVQILWPISSKDDTNVSMNRENLLLTLDQILGSPTLLSIYFWEPEDLWPIS